ncbi:hypothetical protein AgCh_005300 [Apium graveolens]
MKIIGETRPDFGILKPRTYFKEDPHCQTIKPEDESIMDNASKRTLLAMYAGRNDIMLVIARTRQSLVTTAGGKDITHVYVVNPGKKVRPKPVSHLMSTSNTFHQTVLPLRSSPTSKAGKARWPIAGLKLTDGNDNRSVGTESRRSGSTGTSIEFQIGNATGVHFLETK